MEWVLPAVLVVVLSCGALIHQRLARLRQEAIHAWPMLEAKLRQRHDLIAPLARSFQALPVSARKPAHVVIKARNAAAQADLSPAIASAAEETLAAAIRNALSLAGTHPELAGDARLQRLVPLLATTEREIAEAAAAFNRAAIAFNLASFRAPGILVAKVMNLHRVEYFARDKTERVALQAMQWQAIGQAP